VRWQIGDDSSSFIENESPSLSDESPNSNGIKNDLILRNEETGFSPV